MTATSTETTVVYEGFIRFPHLSRRWKSVGVFPTEVEAQAAIDETLGDRRYRAVDRWVHRVDRNTPKKRIVNADGPTDEPEAAA